MKNKIHYEMRLNKNIRRNNYGWKTYKKGTILYVLTNSEFKRLTLKNFDDNYCPQIVEGHGNSEYFDLKDIEFVKVETVIKLKVTKVKLK